MISENQSIHKMIGRRFGRLMVVSPTGQLDFEGREIWICRCACGTEVQVSGSALQKGYIKDCGCKDHESSVDASGRLRIPPDTSAEFIEKKKKRRNNKTGQTGVYICNKKYRANIGFNGKQIYLGTFETFEDAVEARKEAELELQKRLANEYLARESGKRK